MTIRDVAAKVGLSPTTVSFVLNDRQDKGISEETQEKVILAATELGYKRIPRPPSRDWSRVAFMTANIEYFNFATTFFAGVFNHFQRKAFVQKIETQLLELDLNHDPLRVLRRFEEIENMSIDVHVTSDDRIAEALKEKGREVILVQNKRIIPEMICVYCDDYAAGSLAAEHALEMGHRRAGVIFNSKGKSDHPRYHGFIDAFTAKGGKCPEDFQWFLPLPHHDMAEEIARRAQLNTLPSFFYCFADNLMFPAIKGFAKSGFKVPDDVSLMGTDNLYWGSISTPAFSTVDLREELFAEKVIEAVKNALENRDPYQLAVPVKLVPRETVRNL